MLSSSMITSSISQSQKTSTRSALLADLFNQYRRLTNTDKSAPLTIETVELLLKQHCRIFAFSTLAANLANEIIIAETSSCASKSLRR